MRGRAWVLVCGSLGAAGACASRQGPGGEPAVGEMAPTPARPVDPYLPLAPAPPPAREVRTLSTVGGSFVMVLDGTAGPGTSRSRGWRLGEAPVTFEVAGGPTISSAEVGDCANEPRRIDELCAEVRLEIEARYFPPDTTATPAACPLVLRQRLHLPRQPVDPVEIVVHGMWPGSPATCALLAAGPRGRRPFSATWTVEVKGPRSTPWDALRDGSFPTEPRPCSGRIRADVARAEIWWWCGRFPAAVTEGTLAGPASGVFGYQGGEMLTCGISLPADIGGVEGSVSLDVAADAAGDRATLTLAGPNDPRWCGAARALFVREGALVEE